MEASLPGFPLTVCSDLWGIPPTATHTLSLPFFARALAALLLLSGPAWILLENVQGYHC